MAEVKFCPKCNEVKPVSKFGTDARALDGKLGHCKMCESKRSTLRRLAQTDSSFRAYAKKAAHARRLARERQQDAARTRRWLGRSPETNPPFDPWM